MYSLTVTLFSLLIFTGLGSLLLVKRIENVQRALMLIPVGIFAYVLLFNTLVSPLLHALISQHLAVRVCVAATLLAPLALLLGVPFAFGLRLAEARDPWLGPWAWGINGCSGVIGSILSVVLSMNFGFSSVLWIAALVYAVGFGVLRAAIAGQSASMA